MTRLAVGTLMNPGQAKALDRLLDDFEGKLATGKWAAMTRCSSDTALRDIDDRSSVLPARTGCAATRASWRDSTTVNRGARFARTTFSYHRRSCASTSR